MVFEFEVVAYVLPNPSDFIKMQHMNAEERKAHIIAASWLFQTTNRNNLAAALAVLGAQKADVSTWPWKPHKRLGPYHKLLDVWKPPRRGGLNNNFFEFFCRFQKREVILIAYALDLPTKFDFDYDRGGWANAKTASPEESLLIFLWRSAHPLAFEHLILYFGRSVPWLNRVWNGVLREIWKTWGERIQLDKPLLLPERIDEYAAAIKASLGTRDEQIYGFIDGTEVQICRPDEPVQGLYYSGHKKQHAMSHLGIVLPNGLFGMISQGAPAAGGDASLCIQLSLEESLKDLLSYLPEDEYRFVYGDAAFGSQWGVLGPWKRSATVNLSPTQKELNQWLSTKRVMVEHGFGGVKTSFKFLYLKTSLRAGLSPIGIYMPVLAFLWNCRTCVRRGNQISKMFGLTPPELADYVDAGRQDLVEEEEGGEEEGGSEEEGSGDEVNAVESE